MGKCVVKECSSRSQKHNKASGVTFHTIPKDPDRQELWIKNIRLLRKETDWLPSKSTIICSHHFREDDKIFPTTEKGRVHLTDDAVPVFEDYNIQDSPTNSDQMSDTDAIFATDDEIVKITESLKEQIMRRKIERLQTVSRRRFKKIKSLEQKTRRLKARNKFLKEFIKNMRKNACKVKVLPKRRSRTVNKGVNTDVRDAIEDEKEEDKNP